MAYIPETNSVVAFQSNPSSLLVGASIIGLTPVNVTNLSISPSVIAYQAAGSVLAVSGSFSGGNSSVTLQPSSNVIGSVAVLQSTNPWQVNVPTPSYIAYQLAGSVLAVSGSFSGGNSSVTVNNIVTGQSSVQVLNPVSILSVTQGTSPWVVNVPTPSYLSIQPAGSVMNVNVSGSVATVGTFSAGNTSVSAFIESTNTSIFTLIKNSSIAVLQGTNPWLVNVPTPSYLSIQPGGSVMNVNVSGSVAVVGTFSAGNTSVSAFIESTNTSIFALLKNSSVAVLQGTNPWVISNTSVTVFQGGVWATSVVGGPLNINSILGTYQEKASAGNASVIGHAMLFKNNATTSTLATVSTLDPLPVQGSVAVLQGTSPWLITGSIMATGNTSVTAFQGGAWSTSVTGGYLNVIGSVLTIQTTSTNNSVITVIQQGNSSVTGTMSVLGTVPVTFAGGYSIVGTYSEDAAHATTDKGLFVMQVRNDTMSSVTSADGDYSPIAGGPVGETITANAPITKWVVGRTSVMLGTSVQVLAAPGTSIFTYITGINVINESPNTARVTITQGLGAVVASVLTYAIAPAGGGSNATFINPIRVLDNNGVSASINSAIASVYVTITGFTAKT